MKHLIQRILGAVALTAGVLAAPTAFAGDVGASISVGQPGFYGRIDVGNVRPDVIYAQPMVIERVYDPAPPLYLRVPPAHCALSVHSRLQRCATQRPSRHSESRVQKSPSSLGGGPPDSPPQPLESTTMLVISSIARMPMLLYEKFFVGLHINLDLRIRQAA